MAQDRKHPPATRIFAQAPLGLNRWRLGTPLGVARPATFHANLTTTFKGRPNSMRTLGATLNHHGSPSEPIARKPYFSFINRRHAYSIVLTLRNGAVEIIHQDLGAPITDLLQKIVAIVLNVKRNGIAPRTALPLVSAV